MIPAQLELRARRAIQERKDHKATKVFLVKMRIMLRLCGSNYDYSQAGKDEGLWLNGTKLTSGVTRGHCLAIINPTTNALEKATWYDTYSTASCMDGIADLVTTGKIVCLFTFRRIIPYKHSKKLLDRMWFKGYENLDRCTAYPCVYRYARVS